MKTLLFILLATINFAYGADDQLYFFVECNPGQKCIEFPNGKEKELVLEHPALTINRADVLRASPSETDGRHSLRVDFSPETAKKFETVTAANVGKKLVIVLNGRVLIAPQVREAIRGGAVTIDAREDKFWERIDWLSSVVRDTETFQENARRKSVTSYLLVSLIAVGLAMLFAFLPRFWKRKRK